MILSHASVDAYTSEYAHILMLAQLELKCFMLSRKALRKGINRLIPPTVLPNAGFVMLNRAKNPVCEQRISVTVPAMWAFVPDSSPGLCIRCFLTSA
jgi:hypothetical protein